MKVNMTSEITLKDLMSAALEDTEESWRLVNENLERLCVLPEVYKWAVLEGLESQNGTLQDLAASIFEAQETEFYKTVINEFPEVEDKLLKTLGSGSNPYARYRSAFALFKHGNRSAEVVDKIKEATNDQDVAEIAKAYLEGLEI